MSHAKLSASASAQWSQCPGSLPLSESWGAEDTAGAAAQEGTNLHSVLELCLLKGITPAEVKLSCGFTCNEEQAEAVQACIDYVKAIKGSVLTEMRVAYGERMGLSDELAFGTADVIILDGTTVHVIDAKFGRSPVGVFENTQIAAYGVGVEDALSLLGDEVENISLHIIQPRVGELDHSFAWTLTSEELNEFFLERLAKPAKLVLKAEEELTEPPSREWVEKYLHPSTEACKWCRIKTVCPRMDQLASDQMAELEALGDEIDLKEKLRERTSEQIAKTLEYADVLKDYIAAAEAEALARLTENPDCIKGFTLIEGRKPPMQWADGAIDKLSETYDRSLFEETVTNIITPAKAVKSLQGLGLSKKDAEEVVSKVAPRSKPKPVVARADAKGTRWVPDIDGMFEVRND